LFAAHMAYLYQHAYTPITVTQFVKARSPGGSENSALPERPVVLTFDDGYADFFTEVLPVLKQYDFVATLYIPTAFMNGTSLWLKRRGEATRPMLTWDQLIEISARGIECGGHSHSHPQLDILPLAVARDEIVRCKRLLEDHLDQEVHSFAYPFSYHNAAIRRLVQEAGYTSACAGKHEVCTEMTDPLALTRLGVSADTDVEALAALLTKPGSVVLTMYKNVRISMWRLARRCSAMVTRYQQGVLAR
jgi:peptidoglycan/xylan/chitin deacetylase (PgdA/CDA1 family)